MKKILALVLLCAILLSMVAVITSCSDSSSKHENDNIIKNEHKASFAEENRYNVGKMHFYLDNKKYYNMYCSGVFFHNKYDVYCKRRKSE